MKNYSILLAGIGFSLCTFFACSKATDDQSGFASETTNGIALRGEASPGTQVIAYHATSTNADSIEAAVTASKKGLWEMHIAPGGYLIVLDNQDSGAAQNIVVRQDDSLEGLDVSLHMEPLTSLKGQVLTSVLAKLTQAVTAEKKVVLCGLGLRTSIAADGTFEFKDIPEGNYLVQLEIDGKSEAEAMAQTGKENFFDPSLTGIVLEDFNDGGNQTSLSQIFGNSFWLNWLLKDSVTVLPTLENDWDMNFLLTDSSSFEGKSLHVNIDIDENYPQEPSLLLVLGSRGLPGEDENYHTLSRSDTLTFQAKGTGSAIVELWVRAKTGKNCSRLTSRFDLNADWTRHSLAWKDMVCSSDGVSIGDRWSDLEVLKVTWKFSSDVDFWLDQVEIPDLKASDLLGP